MELTGKGPENAFFSYKYLQKPGGIECSFGIPLMYQHSWSDQALWSCINQRAQLFNKGIEELEVFECNEGGYHSLISALNA